MERCVLAGAAGHSCWRRVQDHHVIKRQRIRRAFPHGARLIWERTGAGPIRQFWEPATRHDPVERSGEHSKTLAALLKDPRNRVWACKAAHDEIEGDLSYMREETWQFARELGLDGALENDIARQRG